MFTFPRPAEPLISAFSVAFSPRTFQRVVVLILGAILSLRRRTVTAMLGVVGPLARGHWSDFHRVLCRASWSLWPLGKVLAALVLECIPPDQVAAATRRHHAAAQRQTRLWQRPAPRRDPLDGRRGDPHRLGVWPVAAATVVLAIHVKFPFASRPWALPVLVALYRPAELNRSEGRRHKTPIRLAMQLAATLMHWFPERKFIFVGDGGYGSHELARFCHRHRRHITLVSRFHPQANLYDAPAPSASRKKGRPRRKGRSPRRPPRRAQSSSGRNQNASR